jgi:hypothetical protein
MKLLLLKSLLQRRARDEGFTLPMVIALGLIMILLGAVSMTTANEENITAISQNSRSDALAIAEVGVARYRELLDRNRTLAVNDSSAWGTINQVCDDNISSLLPSGSPLAPTPQTLLDGQDLDNDGNSAESIGSYSLVSYDYTNNSTPSIVNGVLDLTSDAANNNARGILKVQGTAPDGSEAQIEVEIPVRINPNDMTNLTPALWIGDSSITATKLGNLTIGNGNLVVSDPAVVTGTTRDGCRDFSDANTSDGSANLASTITFSTPPTTTPPTPQGIVISDNRNLPSIQKAVDNINEAENVAIAGGDQTNDIMPNPTGIAGVVTFASTGDKPYKLASKMLEDGNASPFKSSYCTNIKSCRYYYNPTSIGGRVYNNVDVITDGVAKTTLLLQEDLRINATTRNIKVGDIKAGSTSSFASSDGFEIYVTGSGNDITINATNSSTINIRAFIHAPDSKLTITGNGTVNIFGSVWVNDFENTNTGTVNISPDNIKTSGAATAGDRAYLFYATTPGRTPKPLTGSPTNWKTEEVD